MPTAADRQRLLVPFGSGADALCGSFSGRKKLALGFIVISSFKSESHAKKALILKSDMAKKIVLWES